MWVFSHRGTAGPQAVDEGKTSKYGEWLQIASQKL
jgi:hypothetical protein